MVVSGGSEINFLYLLDSNQPVTIPAPVQTNYNYIYSFEIVQNGKMLSEIDMLKAVGLDDKANELTIEFEELVKKFKNMYSEPYKVRDDFWYAFGVCLIVLPFMNYEIDDDAHITGYSDDALALLALGVGLGSWMLNDLAFTETYHTPPPYEQKLTNKQLKSIAESYNKRVYNEIKEEE